MAIETKVQKRLIQYLVDEMGYKEKPNSVAGHNLLIESDILEFLKTPANKTAFDIVLKKYSNNVDQFLKEYCEALRLHVYQGHNVAIKIRSRGFKFKFKEEDFYLYYTSGSSIDDLSKYNIHTVIEELRYEKDSEDKSKKSYKRRFDLGFFINGIFFSMLELKHVTSGQAIGKAQEKIVGNYFEAIEFYYGSHKEIPTEVKIDEGYRDFLKVFESAIHIVASDVGTTQVSRNLRSLRPAIREAILTKRGSNSLFADKKKMNSVFSVLPVVNDNVDYLEKAKCALSRLYSKVAVERELLFYNYLERNSKGNAPKLISPRPKQKFGVDKSINRISELYSSESDPNFIRNEMSLKLRNIGYSEDQIEAEVKGRMLLTNNGKIFSILMQYAAGFGKTKIMSWIAIMMNEMQHPEYPKDKLFNKIILLSDRLDLKQQMAGTMKDMPTVKDAAWGEAESVDEFAAMLSDPVRRIVVVNVQKFNWIQSRLSPKQKALCASLRIAFIIDEIHRSHNGAQNERMQEMFDKMGSMAGVKKNLLVGLTATVSDNILRRFGEVAMPSSAGLEFTPFDAFTMTEAIKGGFVLNPLDHFIPIHVPVFVDNMEKFATDEYKMPSGKDIYQDDDYIDHVVKHSYKIIKAKTFPSVRGRGKAMYVGDSIDSAIKAFHVFKELLEEDLQYKEKEDPPKVYIVYSDSNDQHHRATAKSLNGGVSEKKVIEEFKLSKNAIIVVIEKLQTGFDEPSLHTIILNTERKGIEMVQTLCRVNRTAIGKKDCVALDYSMRDPKTGKSKNEMNASEAFHKYAGLNTTSFNVAKKQADLKRSYDDMINDPLFSRLFELYKGSKTNADIDLTELQPQVRALDDEQINDLMHLGRVFFSQVSSANGIFQFAQKFKNKQLPDFFRTVRNILFSEKNMRTSLSFEVSAIEGFLIEDIIDDIDGVQAKPKTQKGKSGSGASGDDSEGRIDRLKKSISQFNEYNEITEAMLEETDSAITSMIDDVIKSAETAAGRSSEKSLALINHIKSNPYSPDYDLFIKALNYIIRISKSKNEFIKTHDARLKAMIENLKEFYCQELTNKIL
jgi:type I restriction enzyme R subunit